MKTLSIAQRLVLSSVAAVLAILGVAASGYWGNQTITRASKNALWVDAHLAVAAKDAHVHTLNLRRYEKDSFLNLASPETSEAYVAKWDAELGLLHTSIGELRAARGEGIDHDKVKAMETNLALYEAAYRSIVNKIHGGVVKTPAEANQELVKSKDEIRSLEGATEDLATGAVDHMHDVGTSIETTSSQVASTMLLLVVAATLISAVISTLTGRSVARPIIDLASSARRIASGDLTVSIAETERTDETGTLVNAFREMADAIRKVVKDLREGVTSVSANTAQLSATAEETAATITEQSSAVAEVSATVEEIKQTSQSAASTAREVAASADAAMENGQRGRDATQEAVATMVAIGERVSGIAGQIINLSERTAQIAAIVDSVNDLAEQSNLLAVNASIEAAKAGEHGRGFSVVASEVRNLAEQSKRAAQQIRTILAEIQKATHSAVMATEEGQKRSDDGRRSIEAVRDVIEELAAVLEQSSDRARQIAGAASQQAAGIAQISSALGGINKAGQQNAVGVKQLEQAAVELNRFTAKLNATAAPYRV